MDLETFQANIKIRFNDTDLLRRALTHRSFLNENIEDELEDNERLEFLGDAILDFVTADMLYRRFPNMSEGEMTRLRAALVRTEALAQIATESDLGEALLISKGEANTGGRERERILCSGFEAVIGAIYLDQGIDAVRAFVIPKLTNLQREVMDEAIRKDPRSQFQEWAQAVYGITPHFQTIGSSGPEHEKVFEVALLLEEQAVATGYGRSKRIAAQEASRAALEKLELGELYFTPSEPASTED